MNCEDFRDYYKILYKSLYAQKYFNDIICNLQFSHKAENTIHFTGISAEKVKGNNGIHKIDTPSLCQGTISFAPNKVSLNIGNKYFEEYRLVKDNDTEKRYIINILSEVLKDGEKRLISIREGYFNQLYSYRIRTILKDIELIDWDSFSVETLAEEREFNPNILQMVKGMKR